MKTLITPQTYKKMTHTDMSIAMIRQMVKNGVLEGTITEGGHYFIWYEENKEKENTNEY